MVMVYGCSKCKEIFNHWATYDKHKRTNNCQPNLNTRPDNMCICDKIFDGPQQLKRHQQICYFIRRRDERQ